MENINKLLKDFRELKQKTFQICVAIYNNLKNKPKEVAKSLYVEISTALNTENINNKGYTLVEVDEVYGCDFIYAKIFSIKDFEYIIIYFPTEFLNFEADFLEKMLQTA